MEVLLDVLVVIAPPARDHILDRTLTMGVGHSSQG